MDVTISCPYTIVHVGFANIKMTRVQADCHSHDTYSLEILKDDIYQYSIQIRIFIFSDLL